MSAPPAQGKPTVSATSRLERALANMLSDGCGPVRVVGVLPSPSQPPLVVQLGADVAPDERFRKRVTEQCCERRPSVLQFLSGGHLAPATVLCPSQQSAGRGSLSVTGVGAMRARALLLHAAVLLAASFCSSRSGGALQRGLPARCDLRGPCPTTAVPRRGLCRRRLSP